MEKQRHIKSYGLAESLPTDTGGFGAEWLTGGIVYFSEGDIDKNDIVNVSILTNDIKRIYETTENLVNNLNLYKTQEEKDANVSYYEILLDYALVKGENLAPKTMYGVRRNSGVRAWNEYVKACNHCIYSYTEYAAF